MPAGFLSDTTFHELFFFFWSSSKKREREREMMQFPVLSRYFLLADKVKVIAVLNDRPMLHQEPPSSPARCPACTTTCLHCSTQTVLFSCTFRSRQPLVLPWQLPPGTGPRAGIPKVTSWGEAEGPGGRWDPPPTRAYGGGGGSQVNAAFLVC